MDKKIITKLDSNQITFNMEEISTDTILKNELLIKELVMQLRDRELYTSFSVGKKVDDLEQLEAKLEELFSVTGVNNIYDLQELIKRLATSSLKKAEIIDKLNAANKQLLEKVEKQGEEQNEIILQFTETKKQITSEFRKEIEDRDAELKASVVNEQNLQAEKLKLTENNNELITQVKSLQATVSEGESKITDLIDKKSELELQLEEQKKQIEQLETDLKQTTSELEECTQQYDQLKSRKFNRVMDKVSRSGK